MTVRKRFLNIEELATILGKSIAAIHGHLARKQYDAVPPPIKLGRRLAWLVDAVDAWIDEKAIQADAKAKAAPNHSLPPTRRRGRPTKAEQKARGEQ